MAKAVSTGGRDLCNWYYISENLHHNSCCCPGLATVSGCWNGWMLVCTCVLTPLHIFTPTLLHILTPTLYTSSHPHFTHPHTHTLHTLILTLTHYRWCGVAAVWHLWLSHWPHPADGRGEEAHHRHAGIWGGKTACPGQEGGRWCYLPLLYQIPCHVPWTSPIPEASWFHTMEWFYVLLVPCHCPV